jgi:hypothetical protein
MMFVQRIAWALLIVCLAAPVALAAGPNAGGVLVVHSTSLTYTVDVPSYMGQSTVGCGQDGPALPNVPVCPPYDPVGSCVVTAANPTSSQPVDVAQVWYVMAAFPPQSCPRLKATGFGIMYDETRVAIVATGLDDTYAFDVKGASTIDGRPWPAPGSQVGWSIGYPLPLGPSTSRLLELYWFAGYAYAGAGDAFFQLVQHAVAANRNWIDDSVPPKEDPIKGYGKLGFAGSTGTNPVPVQEIYGCCINGVCQVLTVDECTAAAGAQLSGLCDPAVPDGDECATPVEETTWGQVKQKYSR